MSRFKGSPYRRQDLEVGDSRSGGFDGDDDAGETSSGPFDIDSTKNIPIARLRRWRVCLLLLLLLLLSLSLSLSLSVFLCAVWLLRKRWKSGCVSGF